MKFYSKLLRVALLSSGVMSLHNEHLGGGLRVSLVDGLSQGRNITDAELSQSQRSLLLLKHRLGPEGLVELLEPDIKEADQTWISFMRDSDGDPFPAFAHLNANVDKTALNASSLFKWIDGADSSKFIYANPEKYIASRNSLSKNESGVEMLETLGGLTTHFTLSKFKEGGKKPFIAELPDFKFQRVAQFVLADGTEFADFHYAARDREDGSGFEVMLYLWLPAATPINVVQEVSEHMAITFEGYLRMAYRDSVYEEI